jgi:hyperosmotically inducible protein
MVRTVSAVVLGLALATGAAQASQNDEPKKNYQLASDVSKAVNNYERLSVFDDVNIRANNGVVTLTGKVTQPIKREELEKKVAKVDGVKQLHNNLEVLPLSPSDDQLRLQIARKIYRNENFVLYARQPVGPIHIVVENGNVTLTGVVANDMDRIMAGMAARESLAFSVKNNLKTDAEVQAEREKL